MIQLRQASVICENASGLQSAVAAFNDSVGMKGIEARLSVCRERILRLVAVAVARPEQIIGMGGISVPPIRFIASYTLSDLIRHSAS